jgi:SAM-dependent methyltransferase
MWKKIAKNIIELTPYTIARKKIPHHDHFLDGFAHNSREHMDALFGSAEFIRKYESQRRRKLYQEIVSLLPTEFDSIADLGCGPGFFLQYLSEVYPQKAIFGYEYSPVALRIAEERCRSATLIEHDLSAPVNRTFDVVVCSQTLEHVHYPDLVLDNIAAASKSPGLIVLSVPDGRVDTYKGHINFWSPESWQVWIESRFSPGYSSTFKVIPNPGQFAYLIAAVRRH